AGAKDFKDNAQDFLDFIGSDPLVAHNADFDRNFINAELERAGFDRIPAKRFTDTLKIARAKFPGSPASLDALCRRFDISLAGRDTHGAIIDSELLAAVYLELSGGRAHVMDFGGAAQAAAKTDRPLARQRPSPLIQLSTPQELKAHAAFIAKIGDKAIWPRYDLPVTD
ncbi:MAG: exonuclease domain-containing protein, partial [Robiginitomaculum sp.]